MGMRMILSAVLLCLAASPVAAQPASYPNKPIRLLIPYPTGGPADFFARQLAQKLTSSLGQNVIVDSKSGAVGMVGTDAAAKSAPDGYTILLSGLAPLAIGPYIAKTKLYDPLTDLQPIALVAKSPQIVSVSPQVGVKSLAELIAYARKNPGKLNYSSSGSGSLPHFSMELLKREAGVDIVHVAYRGATPAMNDLLAGHIQMSFGDLAAQLPHIQAGKLVPLAVASRERTPALADVPTTAEAGFPGILAENWYAILAPAGTPEPIVRKLHAAIAAALNDAGIKEAFARQNSVPGREGPAELAAFMRAERDRWVPLADAIGIRLD